MGLGELGLGEMGGHRSAKPRVKHVKSIDRSAAKRLIMAIKVKGAHVKFYLD